MWKRRRRAKRVAAGWLGQYSVDLGQNPSSGAGGGDSQWAECRILDVSSSGAGLDLFGPTVVASDWIVVDFRPLGSDEAGAKLAGRVRHVLPDPSGGQRIGIQFVELNDLDRALLHRLLHREHKVRRPHTASAPEQDL